MHETSIVNSIMRTLEMEFERKQLEQMKAIHLKVGILSNIEPRLLQNAYSAYLQANPNYDRVGLHIESVEVKVECEVCTHITHVKNYRFICENCGRPTKNLISGEEMLIHKVEFED
ncbi:MAG: hydrogenase maturation nickel metallochaperone HypA [Bacteroidota bacterium]